MPQGKWVAGLTEALTMSQVLPYRPPHAREEATSHLGMIIFLASWSMLFAGLFFAYGLIRLSLPVWPPPDLVPLPRAVPALNTLVLLASSACLQFGLESLRRGRAGSAAPALIVATALGTLFLILQTQVWTEVYAAGLRPQGGPYPSVFYALTAFHALHVLVGIFALTFLSFQALRGVYGAARHLPVRLWTLYWHFVGAVWLVLFVSVYLL
jgi:cytochrome c oxidase subunit 3